MKILNTLLISLLAYSASAQVGIGTSSPTVPLDIEAADAAIDINNTSTDPLIHFQVSGTTNFTIGTDVTDSKFKIGTTALETGTAVTVQSTGEVGIGTTSPTATLDVDGSAIFNESGAAVDFRVEGDTEANLLFVDGSTDRVGIGTSTPGDKLDVNGDIRISGVGNELVFESDGSEFGNRIKIINLYETLIQTARGNQSFLVLGHDDIRMGDGATTDIANSDFVLDNDGDLSLGTGATSGYKLHIADNNNAAPTVFNMENDDTTIDDGQLVNSIQFETNDASASGTGISGRIAQVAENAGNRYGLAFYTYNSALSEAMRITWDGNVGIGMTSPSVELDVTGDIEYTGTITDVSDRRLKENFSPIDSVLTKIMKIEGLSYNMINDSTKRREYGVIAQDVQTVFPEMVTIVDPENGYLGVAYIQLVPVLLEATKAQQAIIEAQKQEIETIKAEASSNTTETDKKLAALEAKLNALLLLNSQGAVLTAEN
ncbi:tail fiber domain-containing protein [Flavobacteriales bacterium]|nr:tail fiber domain-containing protein [Flavobacteriales bacterium]